jgi:hypothetical protein
LIYAPFFCKMRPELTKGTAMLEDLKDTLGRFESHLAEMRGYL